MSRPPDQRLPYRFTLSGERIRVPHKQSSRFLVRSIARASRAHYIDRWSRPIEIRRGQTRRKSTGGGER